MEIIWADSLAGRAPHLQPRTKNFICWGPLAQWLERRICNAEVTSSTLVGSIKF